MSATARAAKVLKRVLPSATTGWLRGLRAKFNVATFSPRVVRHNYGTGPLSVYISDPIAESWYDRDWAQLPELTALGRSQMTSGACIFDIGAHQGVVAMMLARQVGPDGKVIAVEPNPHNCKAAEKNLQLNEFKHVQIVQAAVAERTGSITFSTKLNGHLDDGTGSGGRMTVDAVTVDSMVERFGKPDVVFLDVEGAECMALRAASKAIEARADFLIEVHVGCGLEQLGGSIQELFSFFPPDRFQRLGRADADAEFRPITPDDPLVSDRFFLLALPLK
jgi:FkbM family methyltransferase